MRVTSKGQVTIPIELRRRAKLFTNTEVEFAFQRDAIVIRRSKDDSRQSSRGKRIVERATGAGTANLDLSTDQIMALTRGWGEDDFDR